MEVTYNGPNGTTTVDNLTLAEQSRGRVFLQNEEGEYDERIQDATLKKATGCHSIGFINFDEDELADVPDEYFDEPVAEAVFLAPVALVEQRDGAVYVEMEDGETFELAGEFDRAYTY